MLSPITEIFIPLCAIVGLIVGSFLNVVVYRLPKMMEREWQQQCAELRGETIADTAPFSLARPRSACPACGHQIRAIENIPILSYLFLGGKCSACKVPISIRYPLVEAVSGLLAAYAAWHFGPNWTALVAILLLWTLLTLALIDLDTQLLPDSLTLPLLWLGLLVNLQGTFTSLPNAVIGAMAGYLSLWSVFWIFKLLTGKEGMGYGDFKLLAALGAWMGWSMLPAIILLSSVVGAVVGIALILILGRNRNIPIPFGPYLAAAGVIALFWGESLTKTYMQIGFPP